MTTPAKAAAAPAAQSVESDKPVVVTHSYRSTRDPRQSNITLGGYQYVEDGSGIINGVPDQYAEDMAAHEFEQIPNEGEAPPPEALSARGAQHGAQHGAAKHDDKGVDHSKR